MPEKKMKNKSQTVPGNDMAVMEKSRDLKKAYRNFFVDCDMAITYLFSYFLD